MTGQNVMACGCGDLRPLSQMHLRCTGNAGADLTHVVECVDCTIAAGADIGLWPTLSGVIGTPPAASVPSVSTPAEPLERGAHTRQIELVPNPVKQVVGHLDSRYDGPQQVYRGRVYKAEMEFLVTHREATDEQIEEAFRFTIGADSVLPAANPVRECDFDVIDAEIERTGVEAWEFWNAKGEDCAPGRRTGKAVRVPIGEDPGFRYTPPQSQDGE